MTDASVIRAWARDQGMDISARGAIPENVIAAYDAREPDSEDAGVTDADFPPVLPDNPDNPDEPDKPKAPRPPRERRPRPVKGPSARKGWKQLWNTTASKAKPRGPRTDLSEFAEDTWRDLALLAEGIMPPVSKVLTIQAPYAGVTFDAAVKGIPLVDAVLQPVARYSVSLRALNGLIGPAFFTAAICVQGEWQVTESGAPVMTPDGRPVPTQRTAVMLAGLKYSLLQMSRTADLDKVRERAEVDAERMRSVDALVDFIFGFPAANAPAPAPESGSFPAPPPGTPGTPSGQPGQVLVPSFVYPPPPQMDDVGAPA